MVRAVNTCERAHDEGEESCSIHFTAAWNSASDVAEASARVGAARDGLYRTSQRARALHTQTHPCTHATHAYRACTQASTCSPPVLGHQHNTDSAKQRSFL